MGNKKGIDETSQRLLEPDFQQFWAFWSSQGSNGKVNFA